MRFYKGIGYQNSELNKVQAAMTGATPDPRRQLDTIVVVDETKIMKGEDSERTVYVCKAELRTALLEAEQRGDARIKPGDAALIDRGRIRKGCLEALYPNFASEAAEEDGITVAGGEDFRKAVIGTRNEDGSPRDTMDVVKGSYRSYIDGGGGARDSVSAMRVAAAELDALCRQQNGEEE